MNNAHRCKYPDISGNLGYTLTEIIIVIGILAFLSMIALPSILKARSNAQARICLYNLHKIAVTKDLWAIDKFKKNGDSCSIDTLVPIYFKTEPHCPIENAVYRVNPVGMLPTCSNYVAGDTYLKMHSILYEE